VNNTATDYDRLQAKLAYRFSDISLLSLALTHRSYSKKNNERLEFLGDALLNTTIAEYIFKHYPEEREGILSRLRASLVKGETLADIAREYCLSEYLIMGEGELKSGGFRRDSILADVVEALIGAIFVDASMQASQAFILRIFKDRLENLSIDKYLKDPKTRLQEILQSKQLPLPQYTIVDVQGESHDQAFTISCETKLYPDTMMATASTRRQAEKKAASKVLDFIEKKNVN
jgi:ribonuclease-3